MIAFNEEEEECEAKKSSSYSNNGAGFFAKNDVDGLSVEANRMEEDEDEFPSLPVVLERLRSDDVTLTELTLPLLVDGPLDFDEMEGLTGALKKNTRLECLDLDGCVPESSAEDGILSPLLGTVLPRHSSLKVLVLSWCHLMDEQAAALGKALASSSSTTTTSSIGSSTITTSTSTSNSSRLECLNLFGNYIDDEGVQALAHGLVDNASLTTLRIGDNVFGDAGIEAMAAALRGNKTLTYLDVCYSRVSHVGTTALSASLRFNSTLQHLDLKGCFVETDPDAVFCLTDGVLSGRSCPLKTLNLSKNNLEDRHAVRIGKALCTNTSLEEVDLCGNGIGDAGSSALATSVLRRNSTLKRLRLCGNKIGKVGVAALISTLQAGSNSALESLPCYGNAGVTPEQEEAVTRLCEANCRAKATFEKLKAEKGSIGLGLWPKALELISQKQDFLFSVLTSNPQLALEPRNKSKRRSYDEAFSKS